MSAEPVQKAHALEPAPVLLFPVTVLGQSVKIWFGIRQPTCRAL